MPEDDAKSALPATYCKGGPTIIAESLQLLQPIIQTADSRSSSVCSMLALSSQAHHGSVSSQALNKYLYRRVKNTVMSIVVQLGRKRRNAEKSAGTGSLKLPRKTSFVFTEDNALRRIVKRIFKECPGMSRCEDREGFLVRLIQLMDESESNDD
jgi:hypothetical protein